MPIIRVEICGVEDAGLAEGLAGKIREAFVESFKANIRHVDVRVSAAPPSHFAGTYEANDEPVWTDVLMRDLPALPERRGKTLAFTQALAAILGRGPSTIVLHLHAAPKDHIAFGGKLLIDLERDAKSRK
jgi:phenylpyruvate tautomerase PptA (4-oxalocrotonate tautomerase family)